MNFSYVIILILKIHRSKPDINSYWGESNHLSEFNSSLLKQTEKIHDPDRKLCAENKMNPDDSEIAEMILYESVLPISSFIFLTEIENMAESEMNDLCDDVVFESMKVLYATKNIGNNCRSGNETEREKENSSTDDRFDTINLISKKENSNTFLDIGDSGINSFGVQDNDSSSDEIEVCDENEEENNEPNKLTIGESKLESQVNDAIEIKPESYEHNKAIKKDIRKLDTENNVENPSVKLKDEELVISTKKELLEYLNVFSNFSEKLDIKNSRLKKALEKRNALFERDKSQIAKILYHEKIHQIKDLINKLSNDKIRKIIDVKNIHLKNDKYRRMIKALRRAIIETENLSKTLEREKREFIHEFSRKKYIPENMDLFELKIAFNLGGSIFAPGVFMQIAQNIIMPEKDATIEKSVTSILNPIESLELYIRHKSNTEKKEEIIKFLLACMEKRNNVFFDEIDEAFKARSVLLDLYLKNQISCAISSKTNTCDLRSSRERVIDKYQENFIQNMLKKIKDVNEDSLENFVVINGDVVSAYKKLLRTRSKRSKAELIRIFQKRKH